MKNNNNKINYKYQEIDLIALLISFWSEKKKIYYFILFYIGLALLYIFFLPNLYKISIKINPSEKSNFIKYQNLNKNLDYLTAHISENKSDPYGKNYSITSENIFSNLVANLSSNERMYKILKNDPVIRKISSKENNLLSKLIDSFVFGANLRNKYTISFIWNDVDEGKYLLKHIVNLSLVNVKKNMLENFNQLENLKKEYNKSKIVIIKKELSILKNRSNDLQDEIYFLKMNKGKKLIDLGEITEEDIASKRRSLVSLFDTLYLQKLLELNMLENPTFIEELKNQKQILNDDERISDWVSFNENFAVVKPTKLEAINILIMAIILGFVSGILYLIIINLRQNFKIGRKYKKTNNKPYIGR